MFEISVIEDNISIATAEQKIWICLDNFFIYF